MTHLDPRELLHLIEKALNRLETRGDEATVSRALLHVLAGVLERFERLEKLELILEKLMALDVSALNDLVTQINADAKIISDYIASNPNTAAQDQAAFDAAAGTAKTAFAGLHQQIATLATPPAPPVEPAPTVAGT